MTIEITDEMVTKIHTKIYGSCCSPGPKAATSAPMTARTGGTKPMIDYTICYPCRLKQHQDCYSMIPRKASATANATARNETSFSLYMSQSKKNLTMLNRPAILILSANKGGPNV